MDGKPISFSTATPLPLSSNTLSANKNCETQHHIKAEWLDDHQTIVNYSNLIWFWDANGLAQSQGFAWQQYCEIKHKNEPICQPQQLSKAKQAEIYQQAITVYQWF